MNVNNYDYQFIGLQENEQCFEQSQTNTQITWMENHENSSDLLTLLQHQAHLLQTGEHTSTVLQRVHSIDLYAICRLIWFFFAIFDNFLRDGIDTFRASTNINAVSE